MALFCDNCGIVAVDDSTICPFCRAQLQWSERTVEQLIADGFNPARTLTSKRAHESPEQDSGGTATDEPIPDESPTLHQEPSFVINDSDVLDQLRAGFARTYGTVTDERPEPQATPPEPQPVPHAPQTETSSSDGIGLDWFPEVTEHERPHVNPGDTAPRMQPVVEQTWHPDDDDLLDSQIEQLRQERRQLDRQIDRQRRMQAWSDFWRRNTWIVSVVGGLLAVAFVIFLAWRAILFVYSNFDTLVSNIITILLVFWIVRALFRGTFH